MSHKGSHDTDADELHEAVCVAPLKVGPTVPLQLAPGVRGEGRRKRNHHARREGEEGTLVGDQEGKKEKRDGEA